MTHKFRKFRSWFLRGAVTRQRPAADTPSRPAPPRERCCCLPRPNTGQTSHGTTSTPCLYLSIVGGDCHSRIWLSNFLRPAASTAVAALAPASAQHNNPIIRNYLWQSWILLTRTPRRPRAITIPHLYGATNYWLERSDWNFMLYRILYTPYWKCTSLIIFSCFPWLCFVREFVSASSSKLALAARRGR